MRNVLVTGGHGFIAGYVIEELQRRGYNVIATVRSEFGIAHDEDYLLNCHEILVDIRDKAGMYSAIQKCDGVIHLAGLLGTSENIRQADIMNDVNITGTLNILNACDNFHIPLVVIGVGNHFENNTYSISKTTAERYALMYAKNFDTPVRVVRAFNAYGPRQKYGKVNKIIPTFINKALRGQDINVYGGELNCSMMDMIYVADAAHVLVNALEDYKTTELLTEAGSGVGYPVWEIARMIVKMTSKRSSLVAVPMRQGETIGSHVVAMSPAFAGMKSLTDGLKETIAYYENLL